MTVKCWFSFHFREIFSGVWKLIPDCIGFALLRSVSGNMVTRKQEEMN